MNTSDLTPSLVALSSELLFGPGAAGAWMLNRGDPGLLASLRQIDAGTASRPGINGSSIAANVEHVRYGFELLNRWASGEKPWDDADWSAAWGKTEYTAEEWADLIASFQAEANSWIESLAEPREVGTAELNDLVGSIAHLAYHMGAIRQMATNLAGPPARDGLRPD